MPESIVQLRSALESDAALLARFAETAYRDTFEKHNAPENMSIYTASAFGISKQKNEILDPRKRTVLAFNGDELVGYYMLACGSENDREDTTTIELVRLYVAKDWHGQKVAHKLMDDLLEKSRNEGFATVWLGVWENNSRARVFYHKFNFAEIGSHVFMMGDDPQRDLILTKVLNEKQFVLSDRHLVFVIAGLSFVFVHLLLAVFPGKPGIFVMPTLIPFAMGVLMAVHFILPKVSASLTQMKAILWGMLGAALIGVSTSVFAFLSDAFKRSLLGQRNHLGEWLAGSLWMAGVSLIYCLPVILIGGFFLGRILYRRHHNLKLLRS